jgi:hypothetical protein
MRMRGGGAAVGTAAGTVAAGDDVRIADTIQTVTEATLIGAGIDWALGRNTTTTLTANRTVAPP